MGLRLCLYQLWYSVGSEIGSIPLIAAGIVSDTSSRLIAELPHELFAQIRHRLVDALLIHPKLLFEIALGPTGIAVDRTGEEGVEEVDDASVVDGDVPAAYLVDFLFVGGRSTFNDLRRDPYSGRKLRKPAVPKRRSLTTSCSLVRSG